MSAARRLAPLVLVILIVAACGRSDTESGGEADGDTPPPADDADQPDAEPQGLDAGAFGDLGVLCKEGEPAPVTVETTGLTDTEVRVATFSDPGFEGRRGLNIEFFDTADAFVEWCNSHGGINGREIVLAKRDSKLGEYQQRMIEACEEDFIMVGGGGVFDDAGQPDRLECGLPDISGFMVTGTAVDSDIHVEPVPNPIYSVSIGDLQFLQEQFPDAVKKVAIFTGNLGTTKLVADRVNEAVTGLGWDVIHRTEYNVGGEVNWKPLVQAAQDDGVEALLWVGEPENLAALMAAAADIDYELAFVRTDTNNYTEGFPALAAGAAGPVHVRSVFVPVELADSEPATAQYLELMEQFKPDGKIAVLGQQGLSAWLLFVQSANACDEAGTFTRDCIYNEARSVDDWTGGGMHSPQDVAGHTATECFLILQPDAETWTAVDIEPNVGLFRCGPDQVATLTGDYGEGARCPSGEDDPLPSTCAG